MPVTHILIPVVGLDRSERPAVVLGLQLAAANQARATILHVAQPLEPPSPAHWLDAIDRLHRAWSPPGVKPIADVADLEKRRAEAEGFVDQATTEALRKSATPRIECRVGELVEQVDRFARDQGADLIVIAHARTRWALPVYPRLARKLAGRNGCSVLIVQSPAESPGVNPGHKETSSLNPTHG